MTQESLPSLITLEKICVALGVTLSQFFREENPVDLTESQKEILKIWDNLSTKEQETVLAMLRGLQKWKKQFKHICLAVSFFVQIKRELDLILII